MKPLLAVEGIVTPLSSKSHITYTIHLHQACRKLHIDFAYAPKTLDNDEKARELIQEGMRKYVVEPHLEASLSNWSRHVPLKNLVTISFDDENGFRGAGHRHDPIQHLVISEKMASPGLEPGIIPRGQLRVSINLHCVVTETCHYTLKISEGEQ